jgi:hypothetical protein
MKAADTDTAVVAVEAAANEMFDCPHLVHVWLQLAAVGFDDEYATLKPVDYSNPVALLPFHNSFLNLKLAAETIAISHCSWRYTTWDSCSISHPLKQL